MKNNPKAGFAGSMSPEQYLAERVDDQLEWYEKKSADNKKWYHRLQLLTLIAAAAIPIISLSSPDYNVRLLVAIIGSITAIAAGIVTLFQFKDLWIDYRSTAERLKYEKFLFLTGSAPYQNDDAFSEFVTRIESIIIQENRSWNEKLYQQGQDSERNADGTDTDSDLGTNSDLDSEKPKDENT